MNKKKTTVADQMRTLTIHLAGEMNKLTGLEKHLALILFSILHLAAIWSSETARSKA
jgi:hypothetical protein